MSEGKRPRRGRSAAKLLLVLLLLGSAGAAFWLGFIPQRYSPLPRLSLSEPGQWFVDLKLAALRRDREQCAALLSFPELTARQIEDKSIRNGCGWQNAVRVSSAGGATLSMGSLTCEMAAGLALWITHDVQPLAQEILGARVTRIEHMGGYACRNIIGSKVLKGFRSQHATANAIDISGFKLSDGRSVRLTRDWKGNDAESRFLKAVHRSACQYFRIALGPEFNAAHYDHFHFDRGPFVRCK
ncbi:MAG: extensin family protein [Hyphomicrobiaceae bacterium]